ncbi:hypothetical protein NIES4073_32200 [Kalymmatonema gypsitolerans NIES-4073]|nr:hypothetical protein NIES4073_32200 [Scytonema sp. NIES-4073]
MNLTFHRIWKTSLPFLSPCRREALNSPPSLKGKGAGGLGFALVFPHDVKSQIMNWRQYIHSEPKILLGKPTVKGTRLSVEFILGLFANGWTVQQVLENYPILTLEAVQAVFVFVAECMRDESLDIW